MKFEIKNRYNGKVLFKLETSSLKLCVEAAVESHANLGGADLRGANLRGANLGGANLGGAYLGGANLSGANLRDADLSGANLSGADLRDAYLSGADLGGADLGGANLRDANLRGADLSGADLGDANLGGAYLGGAYLGGADLGGADLRGADLGGANLRDAYLRDADLRGAKGINKNICTPLVMLLDQPGKIRAYKLVNADFVGPYNAGIKYEIGKEVEVKGANTNDQEQCAAGINVATLDWCMRKWKQGYHILIVEFEAKDIACIPIATDGKFRLYRCTVVGEKDLKGIGLVE